MKSWFCAALSAVAVLATPMRAEECKPLKLLASIPLSTSEDGRRLYVPVQVNGQNKRLLLDTGAETSMLSEDVVKALGLATRAAPLRTYDLTGSYVETLATTPLKLGRIAFDRVEFMVSSRLNDLDAPDVVGLLGANLLGKFDVSIDPVNKKLDLLSPDHCPDNVVYWPATGYSRIPFDTDFTAHIRIDVTLDGKPTKATIDTGAWNSTLPTGAATSLFGLTLGAPDTPKVGILNGRKDLVTYSHQFETLNFDGVAVNKPIVELIPDTLKESMTYTPTGSHLSHRMDGSDSEMLIGMNILRHMHLYIAYKEKAFYFTPATAAPAPATK